MPTPWVLRGAYGGLPPIQLPAGEDPCAVLADLCAYLKDRNWKFVKGHPVHGFSDGYWDNWNWCTGSTGGQPNYDGPNSILTMDWKDLPDPPAANVDPPTFGDILDCSDCE